MDTTTSIGAELERQVRRLHDLGYPSLAGMGDREFDAVIEPLRGVAARVPRSAGEVDRIPVVLVVTGRLVPAVAAVERWSVDGRTGWTDMADELPDYHPIDGVEIPATLAYLLLDVDTGRGTLGLRPDDALPRITEAGRTPLTIDEGVALLTQFPDVLATHNAFQALASRAGNRRVPSFWVSRGAPRLGWCWAGNPHTWLGAASASARRAA